ncbi:MAG: hypothetical protein CL676_11255 [Bdellovibrionaceae bacterium]|nr:hypothetical protein [Pseudobdellovibrionaceae bacterium]|tara:strand:- start:10346 stop:11188 length:843 start_codon:yes stop_codon:yes gene_type:complete
MRNDDISPALALGILGLVAVLFLGLQNYQFISLNWRYILSALETNKLFIVTLAVSIIFDVLIITMILERTIGYKKQGSRLRSLKRGHVPLKEIIGKLVTSGVVVYFSSAGIREFAIQNSISISKLISAEYYGLLIDTFIYSTSILGSIALYGVLTLILKIKSLLNLSAGLPLKTTVKGHLTLGSVGEEKSNFEDAQNPKWVVIPQKALNGNILVTGSIGTGKTQGTILTYVDQLFKNFKQVPTALILDPKGSFIKNVVEILDKRGLSDRCIFLGDVNAHV